MARPQRMGWSLDGCIRNVGWRHFFNPNGAESQAEQANCIDHWLGKEGPISGVDIVVERNRYKKADTTTTTTTDTDKKSPFMYIAAALVVAAIGYGLFRLFK